MKLCKLCHVLQIHIFLHILTYVFTIDPLLSKLKNILFKTEKIKRYAFNHVTLFLFLFCNNISIFNINILHRKLTLYVQKMNIFAPLTLHS